MNTQVKRKRGNSFESGLDNIVRTAIVITGNYVFRVYAYTMTDGHDTSRAYINMYTYIRNCVVYANITRDSQWYDPATRTAA